jgi:predicted transcriptional regulator
VVVEEEMGVVVVREEWRKERLRRGMIAAAAGW